MITAADLDQVVKATGAKKSGNGWIGHCPAHDDGTPSLSIDTDGDELLLYCHAGCQFTDILEALGKKEPAGQLVTVSNNGRPHGPLRIVDTYNYRDERGRLLFRKHRKEDGAGQKTFSVEHLNGRGWIGGIGDARRVLFRLPDLVDPDRANEPIYFCEGEKNVHSLTEEGLLATTNHDGASANWRDEDSALFDGRTVYVMADNDEVGRLRANKVAAALKGVAAVVKVIELPGLPEKGDVSDWLEAGHDVGELQALCEAAAVWEPETAAQVDDVAIPRVISGQELLERVAPPREFLIDDILARGDLALLGGGSKMGKSYLCLTLSKGMDLGLQVLGVGTRQSRVLYVALEDGWQRVQRRVNALRWQIRSTDFLFELAHIDGARAGETGPGLVQLEQLAPNYDLIIVDTLIKSLSGRLSENDNSAMAPLVYGLAEVAHSTQTAILVTHHFGKMHYDDPFDSFRGASAFRGAYDVGLALVRRRDEQEAVLHVEGRDTEYQTFTIKQAAGGLGWEMLGSGSEIKKIRAGRKVILHMEEQGDGLTQEELAEGLRLTQSAVSKQLNRAEDAGYVFRELDSEKGVDRWYLK